jgi:putative heme-binding domain-containing protein
MPIFIPIDSPLLILSMKSMKKFWFGERARRGLQILCFSAALAVLSAAFSLAYAAEGTDVTAKVAAAVKDNKLSISGNNQTFGDTALGVPKALRIEYRIGDEKLSREVQEGGRIEISAPAGKKLVVTKAVYGPADGSTPVTVDAPQDVLDVLPGFKVEQVFKANAQTNGSWISMINDPQGRLMLGGQRGQQITRLTIDNGKVTKEEILSIPVTEVMGMLFVDNVLYLNGAGKDGKYGLYRCTDTKGDGSFEKVELLRIWNGGAGEHGAHAIVLGPDKKLYVVCGNFVDVPTDLAPTSPHRNYRDDLALSRAEDGNGFGAGRMPPGGFVARLDLDGKNIELYSSGQRNTYDIAFNPDGELFGFDSDMEWDWGMPWYRPIHVFHSVRGGENGFREGSAKWPEYYPDSLPQSTTIGIGCPTGVTFGTGAKFPVKYQKAFYLCDWTYGRLIAVHLTPNGAGYTGTWENFVAPQSLRTGKGKVPLNLTDCVVGADGALYFSIGGRGTQASLFRVIYTGNEPSAVLPASELRSHDGQEARELRHKLEAYNVQPDHKAVEFAWPHLSSNDRYVRYAARMALERNPVDQWQAKALAEKQPQAALTALLALARLGSAETQTAILQSLAAISPTGLSEQQLLEKLRVIEVSLARQGVPTGDVAQKLIADIDALYPAKSEALNRELCQILLAVNAPHAVSRTIALLKAAPTQEEQVAYVMALRNVKTGWNTDLRRVYLTWWNQGRSLAHPAQVTKWFKEAGIDFNNGASFGNFLSKAHEEAKFTMSPDEITALNDVLTAYAASQVRKPAPPLTARKLVKDWTTADLQPALQHVSKGRNFNRGREVFYEAQCSACHRYGDQGGAVGPDLTAVATRFKRQDLLESMTEPSKVLSEQYMDTMVETKDGLVIIGRVVKETPEEVVIRPNPLEEKTVTISKANIETREHSKVSPMPAKLMNTFSETDILDLLAYLESLGNANHANFKP